MRAIKESDSETRSVNPSQLGGRHSNPVVTTPMIALDFSGTTTQSASHNVALNQVVNQYANQAQDQSQQQANRFHSREIQSCLRFKPLRAAQFVPQSSEFYLTDSIHGTEELTANATSFLLVRNSRQKLQGTEICARSRLKQIPASLYSAKQIPQPALKTTRFLSANANPRALAKRHRIGDSEVHKIRRYSRSLTVDTSASSQRKQQQQSDVAFLFPILKRRCITNPNDVAAYQQLKPDPFRNNQQLVTLNNSNDDVSEFLLTKAKRHRVAPTAESGPSQIQQLNIATTSAVNSTGLTNTCRLLRHQDADSDSSSPMHFTTDDLPQIEQSTAFLPTDFDSEFAQLRATDALVLTDVLRKEMQAQKTVMSQELDVIRKVVQDQKATLSNDLMEFRVQG
ncbi:hypothetical protein F511_40118 [Dorcoceras hygrometricum]|uniref:Uncharacterized protein n=1 Tax=Dorcoceras hygrometricum TaxID=472368 RepID=A0A2Z7CTH5_9LAMI|nr:hypothetical protein F511_40118 [Dorcoceras hygrometricum]